MKKCALALVPLFASLPVWAGGLKGNLFDTTTVVCIFLLFLLSLIFSFVCSFAFRRCAKLIYLILCGLCLFPWLGCGLFLLFMAEPSGVVFLIPVLLNMLVIYRKKKRE